MQHPLSCQQDSMSGHSRRAAAAQPNAPSQLLCALAQCNDTIWNSHLVPKLRAQGSLPNVALSCTQLRALCHGNADSLCFSHSSTQQHQQHLEQLPARFAACTTVQYIAETASGVSHLAQLLPMLSRWVVYMHHRNAVLHACGLCQCLVMACRA
jgi:hypothetical protein